ncbi:MAG: hypothetical protein A2725_03140 [Candidatus Magasanikbacteria bacterium RIFCSPHIGHO2_01_FULL_33_34]|uniref:Carbohydrate kinase PfkB domain-containing protein n=1 Tax=Candidatus Magasanikbacteria bacterium RIFCSPHIGHO2_01_FULL_33_34 TaxID=1798671 RepID=A0A1F6LH07_9BACT|nr:MAG: hypothetical protein A2725_03140 [Candidatus Magasanikbacteria bacterium RIFCSPHIGHO2_01_FULL_33_34]OGH75972.1 MAG: hypothetical protein A3A89_00540 [Candidatus Magasanikbacteria bacterium RIFCSPLOWO2_01_FULL_33_34]OGH81975.1 MAG: hypothetical protein A3F93_02235 [Candidatus Magasanikbacteria bacterium RIFCSPLOWO2_12_FULL_34_7]
MKKNILLSGSLAYDYIMDFPDSFKNHILPDHLHILNVCFMVDKLEKNYGGTAGNIAYNIKLLGGEPLILCPLGKDGDDYKKYLKNLNINTNYISETKEKMTSAAHITTDKDNNQITAFYNGALAEATKLNISDIKDEFDIVLISPTQKEAMIKHAHECYDQKIKFVFDPGQQITAFDQQEMLMMLGMANFLIANDYEIKLIANITNLTEQDIIKKVDIMIKTLGSDGSVIYTKDELIKINPCPANSVEDPTGAGDAYRAGFFTALSQDRDYETCGQIASVSATYAIEQYGTQNHTYNKKGFEERFFNTYNKKIIL